ncbi:MAG: hypothetical protein LBI56_01845 [Puniceicoccales bacterium]|jgi:hypothetical protein|nr:hypothetical protein [Puniceicoccales bacterium]
MDTVKNTEYQTERQSEALVYASNPLETPENASPAPALKSNDSANLTAAIGQNFSVETNIIHRDLSARTTIEEQPTSATRTATPLPEAAVVPGAPSPTPEETTAAVVAITPEAVVAARIATPLPEAAVVPGAPSPTPEETTAAVVAPAESIPVQAELHFSDFNFNKFVFQDSGRRFVSISGNGDARCGFNAIAHQSNDQNVTGQILRQKLGVLPGTMLDTNDPIHGIATASNILQQPIVAIHCPEKSQIKTFYFSVPHAESLLFSVTSHDNLGINFRKWAAYFQSYVDFETLVNLMCPGEILHDAAASTLGDALSALLKNPQTIVIFNAAPGDKNGNVNGGHFDAAVRN